MSCTFFFSWASLLDEGVVSDTEHEHLFEGATSFSLVTSVSVSYWSITTKKLVQRYIYNHFNSFLNMQLCHIHNVYLFFLRSISIRWRRGIWYWAWASFWEGNYDFFFFSDSSISFLKYENEKNNIVIHTKHSCMSTHFCKGIPSFFVSRPGEGRFLPFW